MALYIRSKAVEQKARELCQYTGETLTDAVMSAIDERLAREKGARSPSARLAHIDAIRARAARLPVLDKRSLEDINEDILGGI
jgi:antitoxin VapB